MSGTLDLVNSAHAGGEVLVCDPDPARALYVPCFQRMVSVVGVPDRFFWRSTRAEGTRALLLRRNW